MNGNLIEQGGEIPLISINTAQGEVLLTPAIKTNGDDLRQIRIFTSNCATCPFYILPSEAAKLSFEVRKNRGSLKSPLTYGPPRGMCAFGETLDGLDVRRILTDHPGLKTSRCRFPRETMIEERIVAKRNRHRLIPSV